MITQNELHEILSYDEETGLFMWKKKKSGRQTSKPVGSSNDKGYLKICINGYRYYNHRLAWFYVHGEWPTSFIDHINMNTQDNRISNLREASPSENLMNRGVNKNNSCGVKGVNWNQFHKKYEAKIMSKGKLHRLGFFNEINDAENAVKELRESLHGKFTNHG